MIGNLGYSGYIAGVVGGSTPTVVPTIAEIQFTVGQTGSPLTQGQTTLVISALNPVANSVLVFLDSNLVYRNLSNQISYTITYTPANITIVFNQGVVNDQKYFIQYSYSG